MNKTIKGYKIIHTDSNNEIDECLVAKTKEEAEHTRNEMERCNIFAIKGKWSIAPIYES